MDGCGFVDSDVLANAMSGTHPSPQEVIDAATADPKERFQLDGVSHKLHNLPRVRAAQGHSVQLKNPLLDPITGPEEVPIALHATTREAWENIQRCGEVRRMNRTHVHFASEPRHLRQDERAQVLLKVDLGGAIEHGVEFCKASNGVVLTEGPVPARFLQPVNWGDLPREWRKQVDCPALEHGDGRGRQRCRQFDTT
jgi:2'-phosphotransferase